MPSRRKVIVAGALSSLALVGATTDGRAQESGAAGTGGAVFAMSNATADNQVVAYRRAADGRLTRAGTTSTRGRGIGTDLDTTGALRLSADRRFLYAANAGSNEVTVFSVNGTGLTFLQKVPAGDQPNSLTLHGNLLYILNGSVAGNGIRGFRVAGDGRLAPLPNSFRALSSPIAVPGQVQFSPDGRALLVTQKTSNVLLRPQNAIDVFTVASGGLASAVPRRVASAGLRPFSLDFRGDGTLVVVEAANAAPGKTTSSSYRLRSGGGLSVISDAVGNGQTDGCWVVITRDGRYAYTSNFGSGTISSYRLGSSGELRLLEGRAASTGAGSQPVDLALSADGRFLYLLAAGLGGVAAFRIDEGGGLAPRGTVTGGLPVADGASGLAAF